MDRLRNTCWSSLLVLPACSGYPTLDDLPPTSPKGIVSFEIDFFLPRTFDPNETVLTALLGLLVDGRPAISIHKDKKLVIFANAFTPHDGIRVACPPGEQTFELYGGFARPGETSFSNPTLGTLQVTVSDGRITPVMIAVVQGGDNSVYLQVKKRGPRRRDLTFDILSSE